MSNQQELTSNKVAGALARLVILLALFVWMFRPELTGTISNIAKSSERVHVLVIPLMILLLTYHHRAALAERLSKCSLWGIVLLLIGLALYAAATWPFNYAYVHNVAMIPVLAGIVLVTCGWGVLKFSLPMLLLVMLAFPIGSRIYARLIIRPETYTIAGSAATLARLPGVDTVVRGLDIFFESDFVSGVVALGESNRGAKLLLAFATIGVFVVFSRSRSIWRLIVVGFAAVPIIFFCNFFRFFCWAVLEIYAIAAPAGMLARNISTTFSLLLAYALFAFVSSAGLNLFVDIEETARSQETTYA